jgi:predicted RNA-binding Zn-ribbon protein involved in translation (DUF1610 family)
MILPHEPDLVAVKFGCPDCGEREPNLLVWLEDDETVCCVTCGREYRPGEE